MSAYESFLFVTAAPSSSLLPATTAYAESAATAFIPIFLHVRGSGCWLATTVGSRYGQSITLQSSTMQETKKKGLTQSN